MRHLILAVALATVAVPAFAVTKKATPAKPAAALAPPPQPQAPPRPPPTPPRVFIAAGYSQPAIPAAACRVVDANHAQCVIPAMTAGRYLALAAGASTATGADAAQELAIAAGDQNCRITYLPNAQTPWAAGAKHLLQAGCLFTVITDTPLVIEVGYFDRGATKDPAGPVLQVAPEPWNGATSARVVTIPEPAPAPAPSPK